MDKQIDDGGPAFPRPESGFINYLAGGPNDNMHPQEGMSLRDYLAAKAMQGKASSMITDCAVIAAWAYAVADAMLAERERK